MNLFRFQKISQVVVRGPDGLDTFVQNLHKNKGCFSRNIVPKDFSCIFLGRMKEARIIPMPQSQDYDRGKTKYTPIKMNSTFENFLDYIAV